MRRVILCAVLLIIGPIFGLPQEDDPAGPNFTGDYVLIRTTGAWRGSAPKELHILQTEHLFRVGAVDGHGQTNWTHFPLKSNEGGNGKVKAYFSYGGLTPERAIDLRQGYYRQSDRWTFLGKDTIKVCKDAYARRSLWEELEKTGCAEYSRQAAAAPRPYGLKSPVQHVDGGTANSSTSLFG